MRTEPTKSDQASSPAPEGSTKTEPRTEPPRQYQPESGHDTAQRPMEGAVVSPGTASGRAPYARKINGLAVTGMVLGIIGFLAWFTGLFQAALGLLAVIFSAVGLNRASKGKGGKGMAIAGLVLGILALIVYGVLGSMLHAFWII